MAYLVNITSRAERDLTQLYRQINAEYSGAALKWYRGLKEAFLSLEELDADRLAKMVTKIALVPLEKSSRSKAIRLPSGDHVELKLATGSTVFVSCLIAAGWCHQGP
jgi:hypothetical protein